MGHPSFRFATYPAQYRVVVTCTIAREMRVIGNSNFQRGQGVESKNNFPEIGRALNLRKK
jgi:hypothetical protein